MLLLVSTTALLIVVRPHLETARRDQDKGELHAPTEVNVFF
jgi:hypothetical protein